MMGFNKNGRLSKIEDILIKHDERMNAHDAEMRFARRTLRSLTNMMAHQEERLHAAERNLENTERLLVLEGDRIERLERLEARQNELFAEISEQLRNLKG
jgi:hypothetical protein